MLIRRSVTIGLNKIYNTYNNKKDFSILGTDIGVVEMAIGGCAVAATGTVPALCYKVAEPSEMLAFTGLGINGVKIRNKGIQWPFQTCTPIKLNPVHIDISIAAMSKEMLEFTLPGSFTIGPKDDTESLIKYAKYITGCSENFAERMIAIIEGETRICAGQMNLEDIFNNRSEFKDKIIGGIEIELDKFGLKVYNGNIKELRDTPGSGDYFNNRRQKTRSLVEGKAKVDIADAKMNSDIGEKNKNSLTRMSVAKLEAEAIEQENSSKNLINESNTNLTILKAKLDRESKIAESESSIQSEMRKVELLTELEEKKKQYEIKTQQAKELSAAYVKSEVTIINANAELEAAKIRADANLYSEMKKAEASFAMLEARSRGVEKLLQSFNGDTDNLLRFIMMESGIYTELAKTNASAIQGLSPKITSWTTGSNSPNPITNIMQLLPPIVSTIEEQTGIKILKDHITLPDNK